MLCGSPISSARPGPTMAAPQRRSPAHASPPVRARAYRLAIPLRRLTTVPGSCPRVPAPEPDRRSSRSADRPLPAVAARRRGMAVKPPAGLQDARSGRKEGGGRRRPIGAVRGSWALPGAIHHASLQRARHLLARRSAKSNASSACSCQPALRLAVQSRARATPRRRNLTGLGPRHWRRPLPRWSGRARGGRGRSGGRGAGREPHRFPTRQQIHPSGAPVRRRGFLRPGRTDANARTVTGQPALARREAHRKNAARGYRPGSHRPASATGGTMPTG